MRTGISSLCCLLMIALVVPAGIAGENGTGENPDWAKLVAVQAGSNIEVRLKDGGTFKGNFQNVSETAVSITRKARIMELEKEKILRVQQLSRSYKKPVLIGTVLGAGTGAIFGAAIGGCTPQDFICFDRKGTIPAGAAAFSLVGAVTGLLVGRLHHRKAVVYEAPR